MITPRFSLSQTASTLTINIRAPYCNLSELDVNAEENKFIFTCSPYYLRLNLPGNIVENEKSKSSFDTRSGEFAFTYEKEHENEEFPNLDFITSFLQPRKVDVYECGRKIEVLTAEEENESAAEICSDSSPGAYGFALRGGYNFKSVNSEFADIFNIDPYEVEFRDRKALRIASERNKFDRDHYTADMLDDTEIKEIIKQPCPWDDLSAEDITFTGKELDFLKDLPNVSYNLTADQINYCNNSLFEILFAYCYDRRTTFYEGTCESDWTISNISASLSWFDGFSNPKEAIICAYRRSLIYPLYRAFELCDRVFNDLKRLLHLGNKFIVRCLIDIHDIFLNGNSGRYVLNKLFIDDYVVYAMKCYSDEWSRIVQGVMGMAVTKDELGLGLREIESSINNVQLADALACLQVEDSEDSDDNEDSDDTEDSESDSSSSEYTDSDSDD